MRRTPSSKAACASALVLGRTTGAIGFAEAPGPFALCAQPVKNETNRQQATGDRRRAIPDLITAGCRLPVASRPFPKRGVRANQALLITADLFDAVEGDAGLARAGREALLRLLGEFVLRQARQRRPDGLGVLVVDADRQRLLVAGLVGVERLVLDDHDDLLELVPVHLLFL